jgi:hypothetical protein
MFTQSTALAGARLSAKQTTPVAARASVRVQALLGKFRPAQVRLLSGLFAWLVMDARCGSRGVATFALSRCFSLLHFAWLDHSVACKLMQAKVRGCGSTLPGRLWLCALGLIIDPGIPWCRSPSRPSR